MVLSSSKYSTPLNVHPYVLLFLYMLYSFLTACCYFGWGSLSQMLFNSGAYAWECETNNYEKALSFDNDTESIGIYSESKSYLCNNQDAAVQSLFTVSMTSHSIMTAFAGALTDEYGPRITAFCGQLLNTIAWLLLAFSSKSFIAYYPAFVIMGLGADTGYLPTLSIAKLFPKNFSLIITIMGASSTASFSIPLILERIWRMYPNLTFCQICLFYIGTGTMLCAILAIFIMPRKCFTGTIHDLAVINNRFECKYEDYKEEKAIDVGSKGNLDDVSSGTLKVFHEDYSFDSKNLNMSNSKLSGAITTSLLLSTATSSMCSEKSDMNFVDNRLSLMLRNKANFIERSTISFPFMNPTILSKIEMRNCSLHFDSDCMECDSAEQLNECDLNVQSEYNGDTLEFEDRRNNPQGNKSVISVADYDTLVEIELPFTADNRKLENDAELFEHNIEGGHELHSLSLSNNEWIPDESLNENEGRLSSTISSLWDDFLSPQFAIIMIVSSVVQLSTSFYQSSYSRVFSVSVIDAMEIMIPFSFIPSVILGRMIDLFGILPVISMVNTAGVIAYALSLSSYEPLHYVSVASFCIFISIDSDIVFCYVGCTFHARHFGKLCGVAIAFGGITSFLSYPLYDHVTIKYLDGNTVPVKIVIIVLLSLMYCLHGYLWYVSVRKREDRVVCRNSHVVEK